MDNETLNTKLYKKMFEEQEHYRSWLLGQTPAEVLNHTYEYTVREDILMALENNDLTDEQCLALLSSPTPLADVYKEYDRTETDYMETVLGCLESRANDVIQRQHELDQAPLYRHSADYANESGELDAYRKSFHANVTCRDAIETAIMEYYHDNRLDTGCVRKIIDRFGADRVEYVLAVTVMSKDWDARFSDESKAWAASVSICGNNEQHSRFVIDKCNPGLTDLFISAFRNEQQKQKEAPVRMPIYDQLRQPVPKTDVPKKSKATPER